MHNEDLTKGVLSAGAIGMILAGTLAPPASAATIERDFTVTSPGDGWCSTLSIEFFTPGSKQVPRHESITACGNQKKTVHYRSNLTHDSLVGLEFWGWFFVGIPWCWGCAGTLSGR